MSELIYQYGPWLGLGLFYAGFILGGFFQQAKLHQLARRRWVYLLNLAATAGVPLIWLYGDSALHEPGLQPLRKAFSLAMLALTLGIVLLAVAQARLLSMILRIVSILEKATAHD